MVTAGQERRQVNALGQGEHANFEETDPTLS